MVYMKTERIPNILGTPGEGRPKPADVPGPLLHDQGSGTQGFRSAAAEPLMACILSSAFAPG